MDDLNNNYNEENKKEPIHPIPGQPYSFNSETQTEIKEKEGNGYIGISIASMVLGILGLLCCYCGLLFSIVGLVLGCVSLSQKYDGKGMAIAGIVMGGIGVILSIVLIVFYGTINFNCYY
ncbi:MAG: DUF4190 domain-containing protein [Lachnospirales bacterium]